MEPDVTLGSDQPDATALYPACLVEPAVAGNASVRLMKAPAPMPPFHGGTAIVADIDAIGQTLIYNESWIAEFVGDIGLKHRVAADGGLSVAAELDHIVSKKAAHLIWVARLDRSGVGQAALPNLVAILADRRRATKKT